MQLTPTGKSQRFGAPGLIVYITLLGMFIMFSVDMYTPALPVMTDSLNTSEQLISMTVVLFVVFVFIGILLFGPVSDRYGRRPILLICIAVYIITSFGCAFSPDIIVLLLFRSLQAIVAGGVMAMSTAVVRDCFEAKSRETVIMISQAIFIIGPIAAPIFGAVVLIWFSWRAIFVTLACGGTLGLILTFIFKESLSAEEHMTGSLLHSFTGLAVVARNKRFMTFMLVCTIFTALPFNAYLTVCAFIYEGTFGLTPQEFSYFFSITAALSIVGLVVYRTIGQKVNLRHLTTVLIILCGAVGIGTIGIGSLAPVIFLVLMAMFQMISTIVRPYSVNILFDIQKEDTGSASSMMNCSYTIIGAVGMFPVTIIAGNYISSIGILIVIGVIGSAILWIYMLRSNIKIPRIND